MDYISKERVTPEPDDVFTLIAYLLSSTLQIARFHIIIRDSRFVNQLILPGLAQHAHPVLMRQLVQKAVVVPGAL